MGITGVIYPRSGADSLSGLYCSYDLQVDRCLYALQEQRPNAVSEGTLLMAGVSLEKIEAIAPDQASLVAARKLVKPSGWSGLSCDSAGLIWGECQGSGDLALSGCSLRN